MSTGYEGPQVVGLDLHRRRSVLVRMTSEGQRLGTVRIDNDRLALAAEIARAGPSPEVVLPAIPRCEQAGEGEAGGLDSWHF